MTAPPAGALEACLALLPLLPGEKWEASGDYVRTHFCGEGGWLIADCGGCTIARGTQQARAITAAVNLLKDHGPALLAALRLRECVGQARMDLRLMACDMSLLRPDDPLSVAGRKHYAERINATADDLARVLEESATGGEAALP